MIWGMSYAPPPPTDPSLVIAFVVLAVGLVLTLIGLAGSL